MLPINLTYFIKSTISELLVFLILCFLGPFNKQVCFVNLCADLTWIPKINELQTIFFRSLTRFDNTKERFISIGWSEKERRNIRVELILRVFKTHLLQKVIFLTEIGEQKDRIPVNWQMLQLIDLFFVSIISFAIVDVAFKC